MKVAVVGAGVMGCAAARALARSGNEVVLFEQFHVGHRRGSSHGTSRIYRYSYPDPRYVAMMRDALPLWRELEKESGTKLLFRTGGLDMGKPLHDHAAALDDHDIPYELLSGTEVARRWPALSPPGEEVLFQADGGYIRADAAWQALADGAIRAGAQLLQVRVKGLSDASGTVVTEESEERFDVVVVTAGGWAADLLAASGIHVEVRPTRETVAYFRHPDVTPTIVDWGDPSVYALADPRRGIKAGEHIAGPTTDPAEEGRVNEASVARLEEWVSQRFPRADPEPHHSETCIYTNTPDEHFVIERRDHVVIGSPCSGHGFKFAPLIGAKLAALAADAVR